MRIAVTAFIAGVGGLLAMSAFGPPLVVRLLIVVVVALVAAAVAPARRRTLTCALAIACAGGFTMLLGYAALQLAFDEGTAAAGLAMFFAGAALAVVSWRELSHSEV